MAARRSSAGGTPDWNDVRLHVVTGKGGTGKTTVAAALALALAAGGRRTLLVEVEGRQGLARLFDSDPPLLRGAQGCRRPGRRGRLRAGRGHRGRAPRVPRDVLQAGSRRTPVEARSAPSTSPRRSRPGLRDVLAHGQGLRGVGRRRAGRRPSTTRWYSTLPPTGRITSFLNVNHEMARSWRAPGPCAPRPTRSWGRCARREPPFTWSPCSRRCPSRRPCDGIAELRLRRAARRRRDRQHGSVSLLLRPTALSRHREGDSHRGVDRPGVGGGRPGRSRRTNVPALMREATETCASASRSRSGRCSASRSSIARVRPADDGQWHRPRCAVRTRRRARRPAASDERVRFARPPHLRIDEILADPAIRIIVCCGAGGVGKTTTAAALAAAGRGDGPQRRRPDDRPRQAPRPGAGPRRTGQHPAAGRRASALPTARRSLFAMMLDMKRTFDEIVESHCRSRPGAADPRQPLLPDAVDVVRGHAGVHGDGEARPAARRPRTRALGPHRRRHAAVPQSPSTSSTRQRVWARSWTDDSSVSSLLRRAARARASGDWRLWGSASSPTC